VCLSTQAFHYLCLSSKKILDSAQTSPYLQLPKLQWIACMATPRNSTVSLAVTPYYHCTSRCVRGAFLCGKDKNTGANYKHRQRWLDKRLRQLARIFSIQICSYAVMENHFHVVIHIDAKVAQAWSHREIVIRWHQLFKSTYLSEKFLENRVLSSSEKADLNQLIERWRRRLYDIGWFMRCVKEPIARRANKEDDCKGHFWEGRYHSQALLDERALIACMAYVDLNPLRAGVCKRPEQAQFTSLRERIRLEQSTRTKLKRPHTALVPFNCGRATKTEQPLPFDFSEYLQLVDWTARQTRADKTGKLDANAPPILERCGIQTSKWLTVANDFGQKFSTMAGSITSVTTACAIFQKKTTRGISNCRHYFGT